MGETRNGIGNGERGKHRMIIGIIELIEVIAIMTIMDRYLEFAKDSLILRRKLVEGIANLFS